MSRSNHEKTNDAPDAQIINDALHPSHSDQSIAPKILTGSAARRGSFFIQTPDDNPRYFMGHKNRGISLIINNRTFHKNLNLTVRTGSDADADAMESACAILGFEKNNIHRCNDLSIRDMQNAFRHFAGLDFSNMDCFFCTILTHGKESGLLYGVDGGMTLDQLIESFKTIKNPSLIGKPKIFLIQACRGTKFDEGLDYLETDGNPQRIAVESDYLFAFSSVPGYFSWRNSAKGSWFVQALARVIHKHQGDQEMDFLKMLTRVNYQVAYHFQSNVPSDESRHLKKQMPCILSMLTKDLYFF